MEIAGFDWDKGNTGHCQKHGVTREEIECLFLSAPRVFPDPFASEQRLRAIGRNAAGRYLYVVFMFREQEQERYIRPISARYMHKKEVEHYEKG